VNGLSNKKTESVCVEMISYG